MCGIVAVFYKHDVPFSTEACLDVMSSAVVHRGPDGNGRHIDDKWGFVNVRLAIVDVEGGNQPIFSDDRCIGIVYNGEVYNHVELRQELEQQGYRFKTKSDTEVVLRAYEAFGVGAFRRLNGMYAFCIWNKTLGEAYVVRDPLGIKPLYVYEDAEKIICCSEFKGLAALPAVDLTLDPVGIQDYLLFRYVQAPYTLFRRVRCLDAGTYLRIRNGTCAQYRYWDIEYREQPPFPDISEAVAHLREKLQTAVARQLMGEVPIGVLLSGGVDSSAIAHFVRQHGADLTTFNIGFPDVNEFEYSRLVAQSLQLRHIEVITSTDELADLFDQVAIALDHPIADPACLPLYRLAGELKQHVTVVLSGEGGDELFGGYPQYSNLLFNGVEYGERFNSFLRSSWYFLNYTEFLAGNLPRPVAQRHWKYFEDYSALNGMLAYDMKTWLPENLMMKADKIMMAHSLEGRFPFLDLEMVSFAAALPPEYKVPQLGQGKWILKEVLRGLIPPSVIGRPKMGFTVPVDKLLNRMKRDVLDTVGKARTSEVAEILNLDRVTRLAKIYYDGDRALALQLWSLFVLLYWLQSVLPRYRSRVSLPGRGSVSAPRAFTRPEKV